MPFLVTVSGNRIPLRRGQSYVIGRALDCDVVVEDTACSRRHAQITLGRTGLASVSLEDLGSRNGTFVNGERVRDRVTLRDGSRIQIGASVFLARTHDGQHAIDLSETGTVSFESGPLKRDVDGGEISEYGLVELLKLLFESRRSVTMHVELPDAHARIEVRDGEVHFADFGGLEGFNGLVKLARQGSGIFWLVPHAGPCERNVSEPSARMLAQLQRCVGPVTTSRA